MKKLILISALVLLSVVSNAESPIITPCIHCYSTFNVEAPEGYQICYKDSTFFCHGYGTSQPTVAAAQHEFDSLYIILAVSEITKWGDVYLPTQIPAKISTNKDYLLQTAYKKE
jgi:hypothetical protein